MSRQINHIVLLGFFCLFLAACKPDQSQVFVQLTPAKTGIDFENVIEEDDQYNVFEFTNIYTGAGVAAGDINNDGLTDLYFSGNRVSGRLYLNKGDLKFEDITETSGVENTRWGTGASMVDINQDGWLDIYVSVSGIGSDLERTNLLYINNGNNTFIEQADKYGLADSRQIMHTSFFDYDLDGDLDAYMLVNPVTYSDNVNIVQPRLLQGEAPNTDALYRNNGDLTFTDISKEAGILVEGYGLGVAISDINNDNWPDIYISNDFISNDVLYINNKDGTFTNQAREYLKHTSYAGMGNDVADFNNDGLVDIVVLDMLPEDHQRLKLFIPSASYDKFQMMIRSGYEHQYTRNTLQLNRGEGLFSEIGFLSGISSTDWSWSALLADYDNDGDKDLFAANGFMKDLGNLDYINYQNTNVNTPFGDSDEKLVTKLKDIKALDGTPLVDYIFENNGDLTFSHRSEVWGIKEPGFSHGAVYVDLDNDGDLELVVNTINSPAHVYENRSSEIFDRHFLRIKLSGTGQNKNGIGAKLQVFTSGEQQFYEHFLYRGYESSVDPVIHFGTGNATVIDSLKIVWPDGKMQMLKKVMADQWLNLKYSDAVKTPETGAASKKETLLKQLTGRNGLEFLHIENDYVDFKNQPLLPHMHSQGGPGVAVGDIDGDNKEDFFIGGARGYSGSIYLQKSDTLFVNVPLKLDSLSEDMGALLFDADGDLDRDLYVVSGGSSLLQGSEHYQDRLYINDGSGGFIKCEDCLPETTASGSSVVGADYDKDGDLDLFVGGRVVPGVYPMPPTSYLLRNDSRDGNIKFTDVTPKELSEIGMITSALWTDYDNDGWHDLMLAGEFMPITFFKNEGGKIQNLKFSIQNSNGWWNSLAAGDFDADGDTDYVAGNLGLNSRYRATAKEPLCIYAKDFDKNGTIDPVMCYFIQGENHIAHTRNDLISQINAMRVRFKTYQDYADASFERSFLPEELEDAYVVRSQIFESSYIENLGDGEFAIKPLPMEAQVAPVFGILTEDYDWDGNLDILLVGNSYTTEVSTGRYDASVGLFLKGNGSGSFTSLPPGESGFKVTGDAKGLALLSGNNGSQLVLVGNNNGPMAIYGNQSGDQEFYQIDKDISFAQITLNNGKTYKKEFYYGSTYLSQSSRSIQFTTQTKNIVLYNDKGEHVMLDP